MKRMKKCACIFVFVLMFIACEKGIENPYSPPIPSPPPPPPPPQAVIDIGSNPSPIGFYWNAWTLRYEGVYIITISETNGVGCNISTVESAFYYNNQTYADVTLQGERLNANSSFSRTITGFTTVIYPQIRIMVKGQDDNNYQINVSKFFNVAYF